jgi:two-component system, NarL family, sensor histidine kinase EvgS
MGVLASEQSIRDWRWRLLRPLLTALLWAGAAAAQPAEPSFRFKGWNDKPALTLGVAVLSAEERRFLTGLPELRVGLQKVGAPPYEEVGANGEIGGFQAELLVRLANALGLRIKPVVYADWSSVLRAARTGEIDIVLTAAVTADRLPYLDFTLGTVPVPVAVFSRAGERRAVAGASIALERDYFTNEIVSRRYPQSTVVAAAGTGEALRMVSDGRADFYVGSLLETLDFINAGRITNIEVREILQTGGGHYHVGVRKALAPLVPILNKGITRQRADTGAAQPALALPGAQSIQLPQLLALNERQAQLLAERSVWRIGAVRGLALLNDVHGSGQHSGLAAEYTQHVVQRVGVATQVEAFDNVADMLQALREKRIDFVPFLTPTAERQQEFVFSQPYLEMPYMLLARTDAPLYWDLGSLRGKRLALALAHPLRPLLARSFPDIQVLDAANGSEAMDMVARGDADAAVEVRVFANLRVNSGAGAGLRVLGPVGELPARFAFAALPANTELVALVNQALQEMPAAEAERMLRRWIATDPNPPFPWRRHLPTIVVAALALLLLAAATLWWTRRLTREVSAKRLALAQLDDIGRTIPGAAFRYVVGPDEGFVGAFYSSGTEAFLGVKPQRGTTLLHLMAPHMPPAQAAAALALQEACARSGDVFRFTGEYNHPDGRTLWLKAEAVGRREPNGAIVWTGYAVDVTPERRLEQQMSREARERHLMLASASHELRAPTHTLALALQALQPEDLQPAQAGAVRVASDAARTLARLLDDVLDAARVQAGHLEIRAQDFDLPALLERLRQAYAGPMQAKQLSFDVDLADGVPTYWRQDPMRLRQVLTNLLSNALKYTTTGSVRLAVRRAEATPQTLLFEVHDTGVGIDAEHQSSVFEPFGGAPTLPGSSGLGLSICRRIVQAMGGQIELSSRPGGGTRVTVSLPGAGPAGPLAPVRAHGKVLLCDDDPVSRLLLAQALGQAGHAVIEAADGQRALSLWRGGGVRIVITDLRMPGMDGMELMQTIRAEEQGHGERTALIVCSGDPLPPTPDVGGGAAPWCDAVLTKPVQLPALRAALAPLAPTSEATAS